MSPFHEKQNVLSTGEMIFPIRERICCLKCFWNYLSFVCCNVNEFSNCSSPICFQCENVGWYSKDYQWIVIVKGVSKAKTKC